MVAGFQLILEFAQSMVRLSAAAGPSNGRAKPLQSKRASLNEAHCYAGFNCKILE